MNQLELLVLAKSMKIIMESLLIGTIAVGVLGFIILFAYNYYSDDTES